MDNCHFCKAEGIACYTKVDENGKDQDACFACARGTIDGPPIIQKRRPVGANAGVEAPAPALRPALISDTHTGDASVSKSVEKRLKIQKPAYVRKEENTTDLAAAYSVAIDRRKDKAEVAAGTAECKHGHKICLDNANPADLRRAQKYSCQPCIKNWAGKK